MASKYYKRIMFGMDKNGKPEIYNFLFNHLEKVFKKLRKKEVKIEINRLEPLDEIYTNLNIENQDIKKVFDDFVKSHHLKKKASVLSTGKETSIRAEVEVANLGQLLEDYNILFDIFMTNLLIKADSRLTIDMMDGFNNSIIVFGEKEVVERAIELIVAECHSECRIEQTQ